MAQLVEVRVWLVPTLPITDIAGSNPANAILLMREPSLSGFGYGIITSIIVYTSVYTTDRHSYHHEGRGIRNKSSFFAFFSLPPSLPVYYKILLTKHYIS